MTEIVGKLPVQGIRYYADLKEAIQTAVAAPDGPDAETLLPILRDVDAAWSEHVGVRHVGGARNPLRVFELRGVADHAMADIPELDVADLEALGRPGGRVPGR
jgi:hypothetical protein